MLEDCVERSRPVADPLPVIVVGGGSILVDGPIGGLEVIKPNHFAVANAVGAAIAQVSGEVDRVYALGGDQSRARARRREAARDRRGGRRRRARATASRSSTWKTCRSPICPATRRAFTCRRWEICSVG